MKRVISGLHETDRELAFTHLTHINFTDKKKKSAGKMKHHLSFYFMSWLDVFLYNKEIPYAI